MKFSWVLEGILPLYARVFTPFYVTRKELYVTSYKKPDTDELLRFKDFYYCVETLLKVGGIILKDRISLGRVIDLLVNETGRDWDYDYVANRLLKEE